MAQVKHASTDPGTVDRVQERQLSRHAGVWEEDTGRRGIAEFEWEGRRGIVDSLKARRKRVVVFRCA